MEHLIYVNFFLIALKSDRAVVNLELKGNFCRKNTKIAVKVRVKSQMSSKSSHF